MVKIDTLIFLALALMVHTFISGARLFQSTTIAWERKPDQLSFSEKPGIILPCATYICYTHEKEQRQVEEIF